MYPLNVVLIGRNQDALPHLRRELLNNEAVLLGEFPDVPSALGRLEPPKDDPRLYLIYIDNAHDLEQLAQLSSAVAGQPILAAVSTPAWVAEVARKSRTTPYDNYSVYNPMFTPPPRQAGSEAEVAPPDAASDTLFIPAMRAGAMQVIAMPLNPEDFRRAMDCLAIHFGRPMDSMVVAVAGVQGGCGVTTLAANLAHELGLITKRRTILTELSLHIGMLASSLDLKPEFTTHDLLDQGHVDLYAVKKAITKVGEHLEVLCGPYRVLPHAGRMPGDAAKTAENMLEIVCALRRLAPIVVVDVSATLDTLYFKTLEKADWIILVTEQTLPSIHNLQLVRQALVESGCPHKQVVVVNKYDPQVKKFSLPELQELLHDPWIMKVGTAPAIFSRALNEGQLLRLASPSAAVLGEIDELAMRIANIAIPTSSSKSGILRRLFGGGKRTPMVIPLEPHPAVVQAVTQPTPPMATHPPGTELAGTQAVGTLPVPRDGSAAIDRELANLPDVNLSHAALQHAHLPHANLSHAKLAGTGLAFADLSASNLSHADMRNAALAAADLSQADLSHSDLSGADLTGSCLREANFEGANLRAADLTQANLTAAKYDENTIWPEGFDARAAGAQMVKSSPTT